jgi:hypothetical protein
MKRSDIIFWGVLAAIAIFYIFVGNDMYRERMQLDKMKTEKVTQQQ